MMKKCSTNIFETKLSKFVWVEEIRKIAVLNQIVAQQKIFVNQIINQGLVSVMTNRLISDQGDTYQAIE